MDENVIVQEDKRGCGTWVAILAVALVVLYLFREEAGLLWSAVWALLRGRADQLRATEVMGQVLLYLGVNLGGALLFALLVVILLSQVLLPVYTGAGRRQLAERIFAFLTGLRPTVLFVKEGKLTRELADPGKARGGIAIVDLNSAVVLEKQWVPFALDVGSAAQKAQVNRHPGRVRGPGVTFIGLTERLRGAVSLRKQFRINLNVRAYTSDGIEVNAHVFAIFSLGLAPTVFKVAYVGEQLPENLRVIQIDDETKKVKGLSDELDAADKAEIHQYAQGFFTSNELPAPLEPQETGKEYPPYLIDEERILSAVYSQARAVSDSKMDNWSDLPALVATEVFRNLLSQLAYDEIYLPKEQTRFPLQQEIKPKFARQVKALGVASFQFMHRLDGQPVETGQRVDYRQFRISPVQALRNSKILRDRGIKVVHASFSELKPTDPAIRQQRLDNWRANWQKEAEMTRADQDLQVTRILSRARADKQREMISSLSNILQSPVYSEEALVLRVFQALEDITTDPSARRILPRDTINMLRNLRGWLLPDSRDSSQLLADHNPLEEGEVEDEY